VLESIRFGLCLWVRQETRVPEVKVVRAGQHGDHDAVEFRMGVMASAMSTRGRRGDGLPDDALAVVIRARLSLCKQFGLCSDASRFAPLPFASF
jgi:hypothetical protein